MKLTFFNVLKLAIAVGAGVEIGRSLPQAFAYALNADSRSHYKRVYREGVARETAKQSSNIRVVPDQPAETPTGE